MLQLSTDITFHYEALRALAATRTYGSDISEILAIMSNIVPGDFESWYNEWYNLGQRVLSSLDQSKLDSYSPVTLRDTYFRASHYFFVSEFFLHGDPSDPRSDAAWKLWTEYFDKGLALLPVPAQRLMIPTPHGFSIPAAFCRAAEATAETPRPTLIAGSGFDGSLEEIMHNIGFPGLERGYNIVLYDGPGQPSLLHGQGVPFIPEWEKAVTPIIDFIEANRAKMPWIDTSKLGLAGFSLGGYLSARAAAFEPRLAAVICIDGVYDLLPTFFEIMPDCRKAYEEGDETAFNAVFDKPTDSSSRAWFRDHAKFSFGSRSGYEVIQKAAKMNLRGVADKIKMPAFIGEAEKDQFFPGQPSMVAEAIGKNAKLVPFTSEQAAGGHCQVGATVFMNQEIMEWFADIVGH